MFEPKSFNFGLKDIRNIFIYGYHISYTGDFYPYVAVDANQKVWLYTVEPIIVYGMNSFSNKGSGGPALYLGTMEFEGNWEDSVRKVEYV